jgi:GntR family transcriptional regulator, transcriptional repressor for pyruvate dehydrogenase complex
MNHAREGSSPVQGEVRGSDQKSVRAASSVAARVSPDIFHPLRIRKAVDEVVSVLVDAIHGGLLEPGDRLPRVADVAARLEVSRNTVAEAIARLEQAGVVSVRRGNRGGILVESHSVPPGLLAEDAESPEIFHVLQARRPLETQATLLAAKHATEADFQELRRLVSLLPGLVRSPHEFIAVDFKFHVALGRLSRNSIIGDHMDDLFRRFTLLRSQYPVGAIDLERGVQNQVLSLAALEAGEETRILDAVDEHLGSVEEHFLASRLPRWEPTRG